MTASADNSRLWRVYKQLCVVFIIPNLARLLLYTLPPPVPELCEVVTTPTPPSDTCVNSETDFLVWAGQSRGTLGNKSLYSTVLYCTVQ